MKAMPLVSRLVPGLLALFLFVLVTGLRAEEAATGKLSKAKEKYDTDKDGKLSPEEKTKARDDTAAQAKAREAEKLKEVLAKYDANGNGRIDETEKARMKADEAARAEKYRQEVAKYDADHNGTLDRDEMKKMREDEELAAKTARQAAEADARLQRKMQKLQGKDVPKGRKH
jgi:Ca2+-binding EF-hand superfamily protein